MGPKENYNIAMNSITTLRASSDEELSRPEIRRNPLESLRSILDAYESRATPLEHRDYPNPNTT